MALLYLWAFAHSFHYIWDVCHSLIWLMNSFRQFKSQIKPQLAPHHPCQPTAGQLGPQLYFHSTRSVHFSNPSFNPLAFNPLFIHLPSALHFKSSQSNRGNRRDIDYETIWQVPGTKEVLIKCLWTNKGKIQDALWKVTHSYCSLISSCWLNIFVLLDTAFLYFFNIHLVQSCEKHARKALGKRRHSLSKHEGEARAKWPPVWGLLNPGSGQSVPPALRW